MCNQLPETISDIEKAKVYMKENNYSLVLANNDKVFSSHDKGVKPLLNIYDLGLDFSEYSAADKVVGSAAAFMYLLLNIKKIYAKVISKKALSLLQNAGVEIEYETLTDKIQNRKKTDLCPMEKALQNTKDKDEAYKIIIKTLETLGGKK